MLASLDSRGDDVLKSFPAKEAAPATDLISVKRKFTKVVVFARPLAEPITPPTMRHQAKTSSTMVADLGLPHHTLAQKVDKISLRQPQKIAMHTFSPNARTGKSSSVSHDPLSRQSPK
jgi:hypothetical protein